MSKDKLISFQLVDITVEQYALVEANYTDKGKVELKTTLNFKLDEVNQVVGSFVTFVFEQKNKMFLLIEVGCHFNVKETAWNSFKKENKMIIPQSFLEHITVLTVGTARGILYAKTEHSQFSKYIIPTLNVRDLIPEDGVFSESK